MFSRRESEIGEMNADGPPFDLMACAALAQRFITTCCICVESASTNDDSLSMCTLMPMVEARTA